MGSSSRSPEGRRSRLVVQTADPGAEVRILDARFAEQARGRGGVDTRQPAGLYKIRVHAAGRTEERVVALGDDDLSVQFGPIAFSSAAPLQGTLRTHEYHMDGARRASESAAVHSETGAASRLLVFARDWTADQRGRVSDPSAGLRLVTAGGVLLDLSSLGVWEPPQGDPWRATALDLAPGLHTLRAERPDGVVLEQTVPTAAGWRTQVFLTQHALKDSRQRDKDTDVFRPDLVNASIFMTRRPFDAGDPRHRESDLARLALAEGRTAWGLDDLRRIYPQADVDPILVLAAIHLAMRSSSRLHAEIARALRVVAATLGEENPDVVAIAAATVGTPHRLQVPPTMNRSWTLAVRASIAQPELIPEDSKAAQVCEHLWSDGAWLIWRDPASLPPSDEDMPADRVLERLVLPAPRFASYKRPAAFALPAPVQRPAASSEEQVVQMLGVPRSVLPRVVSRATSRLRQRGDESRARAIEGLALGVPARHSLSEFVARLASELGADALCGAICLLTPARDLDDAIRQVVGFGGHDPAQPATFSHTFLLAEPFHGPETKILDCSWRGPAGELLGQVSADEVLRSIQSGTGRGTDGIVETTLSDYDRIGLRELGLKTLPSLAIDDARSVVQAARDIQERGFRFDLPRPVRELARSLFGLLLADDARRLSASGFVQMAYRRALGARGDFAPSLPSREVTADDLWYSPLGTSYRRRDAAPPVASFAFATQPPAPGTPAVDAPRTLPFELELGRAIDGALRALAVEENAGDTEAELGRMLRRAQDQLQRGAMSVAELAGGSHVLEDRDLSLVASALAVTLSPRSTAAPVPGDAARQEFDLMGTRKYEYLDVGWIESLVDLLRTTPVAFPRAEQDPLITTDSPARIALAGDWGTGNASSVSIAHAILARQPDHTVHLGDVYYAGTPDEERERFLSAWPAGKREPQSLALNSNHEMYSGGKGYFQVALADPRFAQQHGLSYFALACGDWLVVGVDTAYFAARSRLYQVGALDEEVQLPWLRRLQAARANRRIILLSHHNGLDLQGNPVQPLWGQVTGALGGGPDFWYWGHVHGAAVYKPVSSRGRTVRSRLAGHGGIPYAPIDDGSCKAAAFEWRETEHAGDLDEPRRALNGFVLLEIDGARLTERYVDERGRERWCQTTDAAAAVAAPTAFPASFDVLRDVGPVPKGVRSAPQQTNAGADPSQVYVNGIGRDGKPLVPSLSVGKLAEQIRARERSRPAVESARPGAPPRFAMPFQFDENNLNDTGWGLVLPKGDPQGVEKALAELVKFRTSQSRADRVKVLDYAPGETIVEWRKRHGISPGNLRPTSVPYYLVLAGGPDAIPFEFQYMLGMEYAVGRLAFASPGEFTTYATKLLQYESAAKDVPRSRDIAYWATRHSGDGATTLSAGDLVGPLFEGKDSDGQTMPDPPVATLTGFRAQAYVGPDKATRKQLLALLDGRDKPSVVFTASHGMGFPSDDALQLDAQGALLCQDWTGWGPVNDTHYLAAKDIGEGADLSGLFAFLFACYGAGTPAIDSFITEAGGTAQRIAPNAFVAALPRRMLTAGALGVVGHIDRAWGFSIRPPQLDPQIQPFTNALGRVLSGERIGLALKDFSGKYEVLSTELLQVIAEGRSVADESLVWDWVERNDAQNFVLLGDPAARLRTDQLG